MTSGRKRIFVLFYFSKLDNGADTSKSEGGELCFSFFKKTEEEGE